MVFLYCNCILCLRLGKGTSAKDGSALSGALLEHLDQRRISGIFSTHLHELFRLPLRLKSVTDKKMGYAVDDAGVLIWVYCAVLCARW